MTLISPRSQRAGESKLQGYIERRGSNSVPGNVRVTEDTALRHSAVWACIRLRADLLSTFPVDNFRKVDKIQVEVPKAPIFYAPGGEHWDWHHWVWASQADLDKTGNTIGFITERNALNLPARVELVPNSSVKIIWPRGKPMSERLYRIDNKDYKPAQIWHERQFPMAGHPVGLSPVAYAAWSIGEYLNTSDFILNWFGGGGIPKARLKNKEKIVPPKESLMMKERFKASVRNGDIFVHGNDWEYDLIQAETMGNEWIELKRYGLSDVCRFFGCPADVIDAAVSSGGSITYANITERNLQFLIHHLGPTVFRRELAWSSWLAKPRYVKLNTQSLLRMDPKSMAEIVKTRIDSRTMTPNEAREKYDQAPLTDGQINEFKVLFGDPKSAPKGSAPKEAEPETKMPEGRSLAEVDRLLTKGVS